MEKSFAIST